jgi:hypothetical protein
LIERSDIAIHLVVFVILHLGLLDLGGDYVVKNLVAGEVLRLDEISDHLGVVQLPIFNGISLVSLLVGVGHL